MARRNPFAEAFGQFNGGVANTMARGLPQVPTDDGPVRYEGDRLPDEIIEAFARANPQRTGGSYLDVLDETDKDARYILGPHGSASVEKLAALLSLLGPQADMAGALKEGAELGPSLAKGDVSGAVGNAGWGALNAMGLSELGTPLQAILAGVGAKTADMGALRKAEDLEAQGANRDDIWRETGWGRGADGKWRFEIDDRGAEVAPGREGVLSDAMAHPDLYRAYPDLADVRLTTQDARGAWGGAYDRPTAHRPEQIALSDALRDEDLRSVLLHETQHGVQQREGFARGGSDPRMSGEVEARNVQQRADLGPNQRRRTMPWDTEDTLPEDQIIRFILNGGRP
jgi:hypothetical protein